MEKLIKRFDLRNSVKFKKKQRAIDLIRDFNVRVILDKMKTVLARVSMKNAIQPSIWELPFSYTVTIQVYAFVRI